MEERDKNKGSEHSTLTSQLQNKHVRYMFGAQKRGNTMFRHMPIRHS